MKNILIRLKITTILTFIIIITNAQGYKVGDYAEDFKLKNVNGKYVTLNDYSEAKGFVVIFTCNHCPYAIAYEDRIIELHNKYVKKGYPVIAINPNDAEIIPGDSYEGMQKRAKEKKIPYPYLHDETQDVFKVYGATRTPHVFLLEKVNSKLKVAYIGTIDDNFKDATAVNQKFLANAIEALLKGNVPNPNFTKAIGCSIKYKK